MDSIIQQEERERDTNQYTSTWAYSLPLLKLWKSSQNNHQNSNFQPNTCQILERKYLKYRPEDKFGKLVPEIHKTQQHFFPFLIKRNYRSNKTKKLISKIKNPRGQKSMKLTRRERKIHTNTHAHTQRERERGGEKKQED